MTRAAALNYLTMAALTFAIAAAAFFAIRWTGHLWLGLPRYR